MAWILSSLTLLSGGNSVASTVGRVANGAVGSGTLHFEEWPPGSGGSRYLARARGYAALVASSGVELLLPCACPDRAAQRQEGERFSIHLLDAAPLQPAEALADGQARVSYLSGSDPARWVINRPIYRRIAYRSVYPGIDLIYYAAGNQIEYDLVVAPGADPRRIGFTFQGMESLQVGDDGGLSLRKGDSMVKLSTPRAHQRIDGRDQAVAARFALDDSGVVRVVLGGFNPLWPLVIDPVVSSASYIGGSMDDVANAVAVDGGGNIYVTGETHSPDFPVEGSLESLAAGAGDGFIIKYGPDGGTIVYAIYIGGANEDVAKSIAVDSLGRATVVGFTASADFPTVGALHSLYSGNGDAFVLRLNEDGSGLVYSSYLGGSGYDTASGIAVGLDGAAYITGETRSTDFPLKRPWQSTYGGGFADAFVTVLQPGGSVDQFSSYYGGAGDDVANAVATDLEGAMYIAGETTSSDLYTVSGYDTSFGGRRDAFVAKFAPASGFPVYATYLGGEADDVALAIAVDSDAAAYVTGHTNSIAFPLTAEAFQRGLRVVDAYVTKIAPEGTALSYSTMFGGDGVDRGESIAVDRSGRVVIGGRTDSLNLPTIEPVQDALGGGTDGFIAKFHNGGNDLLFSTYFGGTADDSVLNVKIDDKDAIYVVGKTASNDFPVAVDPVDTYCPDPKRLNEPLPLSFAEPVDPSCGNSASGSCALGSGDGFVAKFSSHADLSVALRFSSEPVIVHSQYSFQALVSNIATDPASGIAMRAVLTPGARFLSVSPEEDCRIEDNAAVCEFSGIAACDTRPVTMRVVPEGLGVVAQRASVSMLEYDRDLENNLAEGTVEVVPLDESSFGTLNTGQQQAAALGHAMLLLLLLYWIARLYIRRSGGVCMPQSASRGYSPTREGTRSVVDEDE